MELKDFIKTAITDITDAVSELQEELKNGAIISPSLPHAISNGTIIDPENDKVNRPISKVDFDVAITVGDSDSVEAGAKAGIQIFSAKLGSESTTHTENVSRMTFSIPLVLPTTHVKSREDLREEELQSRRGERRTRH